MDIYVKLIFIHSISSLVLIVVPFCLYVCFYFFFLYFYVKFLRCLNIEIRGTFISSCEVFLIFWQWLCLYIPATIPISRMVLYRVDKWILWTVGTLLFNILVVGCSFLELIMKLFCWILCSTLFYFRFYFIS